MLTNALTNVNKLKYICSKMLPTQPVVSVWGRTICLSNHWQRGTVFRKLFCHSLPFTFTFNTIAYNLHLFPASQYYFLSLSLGCTTVSGKVESVGIKVMGECRRPDNYFTLSVKPLDR